MAEIEIVIDDIRDETAYLWMYGEPLWPDEIVDSEWPDVIDDGAGVVEGDG